MNRMRSILAFLLLTGLASATIAPGTGVSGSNASALTVATSTGITTGTQALVLVGVSYSSSVGTVASIAASSGTITFTKVIACSPQNLANLEVWQGYTTAGLTNATITATLNGTTFASIIAQSWTGTTAAVGNSNCPAGTTGSGSPFTAASVTSSSHANSVYTQWIAINKPSATVTQSSGYTLDTNIVLATKLNTSLFVGPVIGTPATQTLTGSQSGGGSTDYTNGGVELLDGNSSKQIM